MHLILTQDNNDSLRDESVQKDRRIDKLERNCDKLMEQLVETGHNLERVQGDVRGRTRELDCLKVMQIHKFAVNV